LIVSLLAISIVMRGSTWLLREKGRHRGARAGAMLAHDEGQTVEHAGRARPGVQQRMARGTDEPHRMRGEGLRACAELALQRRRPQVP
jgi:hypothetical protein